MAKNTIFASDTYQALFNTLLQASSECVLFVNSNLKIVAANPRAHDTFKYSSETLYGMGFLQLIATAERETLGEIFSGMGAQASWKGRIVGLSADGIEFPADINIKQMPDAANTHFCVLLRDRVELEHLSERLQQEKSHRREMYITLRNVMNSVEKEKKGVDRLIAHKIEAFLLPTLEKIRQEPNRDLRNSYIELIRDQLLGLTKAFPRNLDIGFVRLTRTEMKICQYLQAGYASKEIADAMHISLETIQTHRRNIRKKLGLHGRKISLYTFLTTRRSLGGVETP